MPTTRPASHSSGPASSAGRRSRNPTTASPPSNDDTGFRIEFFPTEDVKTGPNQMHFDLTSTSLEDQQPTVDRALELGGRHLDIGQLPEEEHVVLADPEGNEFCVLTPR